MKPRTVTLVILALAVLLSRTAGLHFHVADAHHAVDTHHGLVAGGAHGVGLDDDHQLEHLAGQQDVDSSAAPAGKMLATMPMLVVVAFIGMALLLAPSGSALQLVRAPFRPPRLPTRAEFLPPSRGPPRAA